MLTTLRIKNLALVEDLTLELAPGYNVITGETGAGKSVILGALNLVLGERADRTLIRSGSDSCSVEAVFDVSKLRIPLASLLEENGLEPCEDGLLVLKRTFTATGTNRQFINGSPTTLAVLASLGENLVDMHGPHDHQSLLHPGRQLAILDAFGGLEDDRSRFSEIVRKRGEVSAAKADLIMDERTYAQQLDLLRHQVNEITAARFQPDEEESVEQEHARASNAAKLLQLTQSALGTLGEDETNVLSQAGALGRILQELQRIDPTTSGLAEQHQQAVSALNDLQHDLAAYADKIDLDPERLQQFDERLNLIHSLKRKYGSTLADVIRFGEESRAKLDQLEQRDGELTRLNAELEKLDRQLKDVGNKLTAARLKIIPKLSKAVVKQLQDLGFKQSHFDIALSSSTDGTPSSSGFDIVEFQFAPNPGEPPRPLRAIASSGEMARVMLALKTVLASQDEVPVLVFDEVDANVGGETASMVGEKMGEIAKQRQVFCITHLAPVAAAAGTHYVVEKEVISGRTFSHIKRITRAERVAEIARMLGGQSAASRQHAESLLATR
ncbi:MAG TPA: DNA repair protein RecN [Roseimicrobium sp.]|nr:DNA repair protein RecN [Roseimicrobium sp.]